MRFCNPKSLLNWLLPYASSVWHAVIAFAMKAMHIVGERDNGDTVVVQTVNKASQLVAGG